jgi:glycosyltransferase involved in cell wall biosynthesis
MPLFSVIVATRDRPGPFAEALASVLAQEHADFEVIVVDDGSSAANAEQYEVTLAAAAERLGERLRICRLTRRVSGHGPGYSRNTGAALASGKYLCFLDDDDLWTDSGHLARAARVLRDSGDLYMANQAAYRAGAPAGGGAIWIEDLAPRLTARGVVPLANGAMLVTAGDLMALGSFCHLNTLIVRRELYEAVGGMDEGIRWEEDRDVFLRLIDRTGTILHHPAIVARHNIPDPAQAASTSTSLTLLNRWLYRLRVMDKACIFARHPAIRAHARQHKVFTLKRIVEELRVAGQWRTAYLYAREALGVRPTLKWAAFTVYCGLMAVFERRPFDPA